MSNGLSITKVCLADSRNHQLVSAIKEEPQDDGPADFASYCNASRVTDDVQKKATTFNSSRQSVPRAGTRDTVLQPNPSLSAKTTTQTSPVRRSSTEYPPASVISVSATGHGSIPATSSLIPNSIPFPIQPLFSPVCAASLTTTLTPMLVSSTLPLHSVQSPDFGGRTLLPNLVNSGNLPATTGVFGFPCTPRHQHFVQSQAARPIPYPSIAHPSPRPSIFGRTEGLQPPAPLASSLSTLGQYPRGSSPAYGAVSSVTGIPIRPRLTLMQDVSQTTSAVNQVLKSHSPANFMRTPQSIGIATLGASIPIAPRVIGLQSSVFAAPTALSNVAQVSDGLVADANSLSNTIVSQTSATLSLRPVHNEYGLAQTSKANQPLYSPTATGRMLAPSTGKTTTSKTTTVTMQDYNSTGSADYGADQLGPDTLIWGRVIRLPEGDLHFPGTGRNTFSNAQSVLRRIRMATSANDSFSLQLPFAALEFNVPVATRTNNWLLRTSSECGSRKGFHACLCCQQTFTSRSLYDSHMMRPVACIFYRCHLCRGSISTHSTNLDLNHGDLALRPGDQKLTSGESDVQQRQSFGVAGSTPRSPYCTLLYGGIIKASNPCAVYSHFAYAHANNKTLWTLQPSLLSVCPLAESAWNSTTLEPSHTFTTAAEAEPGDPNSGSSNLVLSTITDSSEGATTLLGENDADSINVLSNLDHSIFYRPGSELVELWRDLECTVNDIIPLQELDFLNAKIHPVDLGRSLMLSDFCQSSFAFELEHTARLNPSPLQRLYGNSEAGATPQLPAPDSPLTQAILHLAQSEVWQSHLFFTNWCQSYVGITEPSCSGFHVNPIVIEEGEEDRDSVGAEHESGCLSTNAALDDANSDTGDPKLNGVTSTRSNCGPPPAPQVRALYEAASLLQSLRGGRLSAMFPTESELQRHEQTPVNKSPIPVSHITPGAPSTDECSQRLPLTTSTSANSDPPTVELSSIDRNCTSESTGLLRCLLCRFRTNDPRHLSEHLTGSRPFVPTKCALCGQSICIRQPNLCAVKAHLLLHLGYFIMCPQCGFTPPAYLAPDAAELCLRVHLRFVCFHFNLLQVHVCTLCQGRSKAYHTIAHLCQHMFESHTKRVYACLWCARQTAGPNSRSASAESLNGSSQAGQTVNSRSANPVDQAEQSRHPVCYPTVSEERFIHRFSNANDLLAHMQSAHRHMLSVPVSGSTSSVGLGEIARPTGSNVHLSNGTVGSVKTSTDSSQTLKSGVTTSQLETVLSEIGKKGFGSCVTEDRAHTSSPSVGPNSETVGSDRTTGSLVHLVPAVDFICGSQCPHCEEIFERRDSFAQHFRSTHCTSQSGVCCYRCFGSCRRLCFDLDEFRQHLTSCRCARDLYTSTFGAWKPSALTTTRFASKADRTDTNVSVALGDLNLTCRTIANTVREHRLCFCFHCGIGARRFWSQQSRVSGAHTGLVSGSGTQLGNELCDEGSHSNPVQNDDLFTDPIATTHGVDEVISSSASSGLKEPQYDACYFPDLKALHAHENQYHFIQNNSPIACPWCGHRLSCYRRQEIRMTLHHLKSHINHHAFSAWCLERKRKWNKNVRDLPHCFCGAALLDSPLAIISHSSAHLLSSDPLKHFASCGICPPEQGYAGLLPNSSSSTVSSRAFASSESGLLSASVPINMFRSLKPNSGAHIPCPLDVYRHLRFAVAPELDYYLDHALLTSQPFVCPVCYVQLSTRWALTEHAFTEHWGSLCYICCRIVTSTANDPASKTGTGPMQPLSESATSTTPDAGLATTPQPNSCSSMTDPPNLSPADHLSAASRSPLSSSEVAVDGMVSTSATTDNFWLHVFRCLLRRRALLKSARHHSDSQRLPDSKQSTHPGTSVDSPVQIAAKKRPDWRSQNSSSHRCHRLRTKSNQKRAQSPSPIVIASSPDSCSPDREHSSPRSERTVATAVDSDCTVIAATSKRRKRLIIADDETSETEPYRDEEDESRCGGKGDADSTTTRPATLDDFDQEVDVEEREDGNKRKRHDICSPLSSHQSEFGETRSNDASKSMLCVLCGEQQTTDTWEEHALSHRNPQMTWNGLNLFEPQRIVLTQRQSKVYRCYICDRRFVTRFGCQRHLTGLHKMAKARINWDLLCDNSDSGRVVKSVTDSRRKVPRTSRSTGGHTSLRVSHPTSSSRSGNPVDLDRTHLVNLAGHIFSEPCGSVSSELCCYQHENESDQQLYYCTVCQIPFLSQHSLTIHRTAAHGTSSQS